MSEPGCYLDVPFKDYLSRPGWGSSDLAAMRRGPPARVVWERQHREEDSEAMLLGRFVHCALLTPDLLDSTYVCKPQGMTFSTREGKAWRDAQKAEIVPFDAYTTGGNIVHAVLGKKPARESIEAASHVEASLLWNCPLSSEECKGRPDWIEDRYIYDLKVSRYADGHALGLRAFYAGWMHQLSHYRTGAQSLDMDIRGGRLVIVAPAPPHVVYTLEVKMDALDLLEIENISTLKALRECRLENSWPGTPDSWTKIEPPAAATDPFEEISLSSETEETEQEIVTDG